MSASWETIWRQYERGIITESELVAAVLHALRGTDVARIIRDLPAGYRELLRRYIQSGKVPSGIYCVGGVTVEESRRLHESTLEYNRQAVQAIHSYFKASAST